MDGKTHNDTHSGPKTDKDMDPSEPETESLLGEAGVGGIRDKQNV